MIYNVTHNSDGRPLQSVRVQHRLAIGRKTDNAVTKLDHFVVSSLNAKGEWEPDDAATEALAAAHGCAVSKLNAVRIFLLSDDPESAFKSELAMRTGRRGKVICRGNGLVAMRRENLEVNGKFRPHEPCGDECEELSSKLCKPSGGLYFQLALGPLAGRLCMLSTGSWNSVRDLSGSITAIHEATGGLLRGIPLWLTVGPRKTEYGDGKVTTIFTTNVSYRPDEPGHEAAEMIAYARAARGQVVGDDDELELPDETEADERFIGEHHYPEDDGAIAPPEPVEQPEPEEPTAAGEARYTWDDVPEKAKKVVAWYLLREQAKRGLSGKPAIADALANARLDMDQIIAKAEAAMAEEEAK